MASKQKVVAAVVLVVALPALAWAGPPLACSGFFRPRVAVGVPVIVQQDYVHSPSLQLRQTSEHYAARYSDYLEFLQWRAYQAGKASQQKQGTQTQAEGLLQQRCAGCHGGDEPKAGLRIENITCEQITRVLSWVGGVRDVPSESATMKQVVDKLKSEKPEVKQRLLAELLELSQKGR